MSEVLKILLKEFPGRTPSEWVTRIFGGEQKEKLLELEIKKYEDPEVFRIRTTFQWEPFYIGYTITIRVKKEWIYMENYGVR